MKRSSIQTERLPDPEESERKLPPSPSKAKEKRRRHSSPQKSGHLLVSIILYTTLSVSSFLLGKAFLTRLQLRSNAVANFPEGWESFTYFDIRKHLQCTERSHDNNKPLLSLEDWQLFRDTYTRVVDRDQKWDDAVPPTLGYSLEPGIPVPPPFYAKLTAGRGRGLFASRDIRKGELIHKGEHSDVIFPDSMAWRRYIFSLPKPFACDLADWTWTQQFKKNGPYHILTGPNISSLMNTGRKINVNALPESETSGTFYATRDIEKGEEILTDYEVYPTKWKKVGL
eukprot:scaffold6987_cov72-Cyclotella_meneghiniana.AAC.11